KPVDYHRAGVPLYIVVDQVREGGLRTLHGYHWTPDSYDEVALDEEGRLLIEALGVRLGLRDNRLVCYDAETGEELGNYTAVEQARRAAEERLRAEEEARRAAEERLRREEEARRAVEARLRELEAEINRLRGGGTLPPDP